MKKPSLSPVELSRLCYSVTRNFGLNKCLDCAKLLAQKLAAKGVSGELIQLRATSEVGFIVMRDVNFKLPFPAPPDSGISNTGKHYGVRVDNTIYCNVFKQGIEASQWEKQFTCPSGRFTTSTYRTFGPDAE